MNDPSNASNPVDTDQDDERNSTTTKDRLSAPAERPKEEGDSARTSLGQLRDDLGKQLRELTSELDQAQTAVKNRSALKGQVQADLTRVEKTAAAQEAVVSESELALEAAGKARDRAGSLIGSLAEDDVRLLADAVQAIHDEYEAKAQQFDEAVRGLHEQHQNAAKAEAALIEKKKVFEAESDSLSGLSNQIKALIAPLKALTKDLASAVEAGQSLKAYVLRSELDITVSKLEQLISKDHLDQLTNAYDSARRELSEASAAQLESTEALGTQKAVVMTAEAELEKARATRKEQLAKHYVLIRDEPPAAKSATRRS